MAKSDERTNVRRRIGASTGRWCGSRELSRLHQPSGLGKIDFCYPPAIPRPAGALTSVRTSARTPEIIIQTTIALLHGATLNGRMWDPAVSMLSPEFRTLTPDLPGHGHGRDGPFSIDRAVAQVAALVARESPAGAVVVGDSLGGCTAMALAAAHPGLVRGLVLAGCTAEFTGLMASMARATARLTSVLTKLFGPEWLRARTMQRVPKTFPRAPLDAIVAGGGLRLETWGEAVFELSGRPLLEPLARYSGPILFVNGETDRPNRKGEPGFLAAFPRAKLVVFEGSPHGVSLWDPTRFGELVRDFARGVGPN